MTFRTQDKAKRYKHIALLVQIMYTHFQVVNTTRFDVHSSSLQTLEIAPVSTSKLYPDNTAPLVNKKNSTPD